MVAEGAREGGGVPVFLEKEPVDGMPRYGGVAEKLAHQIEAKTGRETRALVLGHLQRGGEPVACCGPQDARLGHAPLSGLAGGR